MHEEGASVATQEPGAELSSRAGAVSGRSKAARLSFITDAVHNDGFVTVDDLADALGVSRMTVHRDLDELQTANVLRKVRGGASGQRTTAFENDFQSRASARLTEKRAVAQVAAGLASEGDVVVVDDSSTAGELVPHLLELKPLTVITNFLAVIEKIRGIAGVSLIGLGGEYDSRYHSFLGAQCEQALADLHADVLFASSSALLGTDVFHQDQRVVGVKQAMMRASRRRVLMMDHSKVGHGALHRVGSVSEFTHVVLDSATRPEDVRLVEESGVEVLVAPLG
jgi:DeoR/GlpR family transcriptional regulator of sugar metabolism